MFELGSVDSAVHGHSSGHCFFWLYHEPRSLSASFFFLSAENVSLLLALGFLFRSPLEQKGFVFRLEALIEDGIIQLFT